MGFEVTHWPCGKEGYLGGFWRVYEGTNYQPPGSGFHLRRFFPEARPAVTVGKEMLYLNRKMMKERISRNVRDAGC